MGSMTAGNPWAVQLHDGRRCLFLQGATDAEGSKRLNYDCGTGVLYGDAVRGTVWRFWYAASLGSALTLVPVATVW
jgi:hypothetical protein